MFLSVPPVSDRYCSKKVVYIYIYTYISLYRASGHSAIFGRLGFDVLWSSFEVFGLGIRSVWVGVRRFEAGVRCNLFLLG